MPKTNKPANGSGKTRFNREKKPGESWTAKRDEAIKSGSFRLPEELRQRPRDIVAP